MSETIGTVDGRWVAEVTRGESVWVTYDGEARTLISEDFAPVVLEAIQSAYPDVFEEYVRENTEYQPDGDDSTRSTVYDDSDVTPVEDVRSLEPGDRVTAYDDAEHKKTGVLEKVEINPGNTAHPYIVTFEDGQYYSQRVEPAEDPSPPESPAPEDVAETWYELTDGPGNVAYVPQDEAVVDDRVVRCDIILSNDFTKPPVYLPNTYNFEELRCVNASSVPFSEVPTDD